MSDLPPSTKFNDFVFSDGHCSRKEIEYEAKRCVWYLNANENERDKINDALMHKLDILKKSIPHTTRNELMHNEQIANIISALVIINEALVFSVVKKHKGKGDVEELISQGETGRDTLKSDVTGMIGALLEYDYSRSMHPFSTYLTHAIVNALNFTLKERKNHNGVHSRTGHILREEALTWQDKMDSPYTVAASHDTVRIIRKAVDELPNEYKATMQFVIERILSDGEMPDYGEVGRFLGKTRMVATRLVHQGIEQLGEVLKENYPDEVEGSVNGWREFKDTFIREHKKQPAGER